MVTTAPELDVSIVQKFAFKVLGDITAAQIRSGSFVTDSTAHVIQASPVPTREGASHTAAAGRCDES